MLSRSLNKEQHASKPGHQMRTAIHLPVWPISRVINLLQIQRQIVAIRFVRSCHHDILPPSAFSNFAVSGHISLFVILLRGGSPVWVALGRLVVPVRYVPGGLQELPLRWHLPLPSDHVASTPERGHRLGRITWRLATHSIRHLRGQVWFLVRKYCCRLEPYNIASLV